jgi:predicted Zn-dependent protease
MGYAAVGDLTEAGLAAAADQALAWARATAGIGLIDPAALPCPDLTAHYGGPPAEPWDGLSLEARLGLVHDAGAALAIDRRIVDWSAAVTQETLTSVLLTSAGGCISQEFHYLLPGLSATANSGSESQRRTGGGALAGRQGGLEQLAAVGFPADGPRLAAEAIALLEAPECPEGSMDLVLTPSQMVLQIHESIGHPLELDRILGDERNYAGTSFVTLDMFGQYRYGSELLNITFDPNRPEQLASYGFDDEGTPAERVFLIRQGLLERPLGGALSQRRAGLPGTANARACHWNRPPIDRMANLNLEPGTATLEQLIGTVEQGVLMDTNRSWSIDDSRNKFQFGCEYGRLIRDGELKGLVRNPNYRGISATFWRSLAGVGNSASLQVLGVTNCGKGEPNQSVLVGHASPPCLFRGVVVFGGEG